MGCGSSVGDSAGVSQGARGGGLRKRRIAFTAKVDAAVQAGSLPTELAGVKAERKEVILSMKGSMSADKKRDQSNVLRLLHEQQCVLDDLTKAGDKASSVWQGEMRFYADCVKCAGSEIKYGTYSNQNDLMLVVTPLSRECRRAFFAAWSAKKVYVASGPAGTGKTETVRDTARDIGYDAIVINGSELSGDKAQAALKTIGEAKNAIVILDEANCPETAQVEAVHKACKDAGVLLCATLNPGYKGRPELPGCMKGDQNAVVTQMTLPDLALIESVMLSCEGFVECDDLSVKFNSLFSALREKTTSQEHYDYGMRAAKSGIQFAGACLRKAGASSDEKQVLAQCLRNSLWTALTATDRPVALSLITENLVDPGPLPEGYDASGAACIAAMLPAQLMIRHGVMVLGQSEQADSLVGAITAASQAAKAKLVRVPGTMMTAPDDLVDGVRTAMKDAGSADVWILAVCATPAAESADTWFHKLHHLLDDQKCLDQVQLGDSKVIFVCESMATASPATVSRLGFVNTL